MNGRQAAKLAAKKIEELEHFNHRCVMDIRAYNACIRGMIKGEGPCEWCEERNECQREVKGKGCDEWWLKYDIEVVSEGAEDDSKGIVGASPEG